MTARDLPTHVMHFTHVEHLTTIIEHGLLSDTAARAKGVLSVEVGNIRIKEPRRRREVPVAPGGTVAEYVPFYFAPLSPMMFAIAKGNVPTYQGGIGRLVYLETSLERLQELGHAPVLSDRNARLDYAEFRPFDPADPLDDGFIDWAVMHARCWNDYDEGRERRMAECLVRDRVAWNAIIQISTQSEAVAAEARAALVAARSSVPVNVRPNWYF